MWAAAFIMSTYEADTLPSLAAEVRVQLMITLRVIHVACLSELP